MLNIDKRKLGIQMLALIGFALTIELAFIYYNANYVKYSLSSFCSINDLIDCDGAAKTTTAQFWGIPLAYWGMLFYITVLFLTVVDKFKNIKFLKFLEVFKNPNAYITFLGTVAFIISMILAVLSVYRIQKICILCVVTYIIDLLIAMIASSCKPRNYIEHFRTTFIDFIDGAKKYTKTFITLVILSTAFLCYTGITCNFVPHIKKTKEIMKYRNMKVNPYRVKGNTLGAENADVVVELYSDYVCPLCYIHNIMLHRAAKEFSNIKIVHYNVPFDKECNPNISFNMHPNACFMAKGAIAAGKNGNYWEMASLLYENQPKNKQEMLKLAEKAGIDKDKFTRDFESSDTQKLLEEDIEKANKLEIDSTPTIYINGEQYVGVMPYKELKEKLVLHGAKHK